jgi:hypothetical protein
MGATIPAPGGVALDDAGFIAWARKHSVTLRGRGCRRDTAAPRLHEPGREKGEGTRVPDCRDRRQRGSRCSPPAECRVDKRVAIPLSQGAESLNVAVAAGILLYEVRRGH